MILEFPIVKFNLKFIMQRKIKKKKNENNRYQIRE